MNSVRRQELYRDFVRSRRDWELFVWPYEPLYTSEDISYLQMLEQERLAGRLVIEGELKTVEYYENILDV